MSSSVSDPLQHVPEHIKSLLQQLHAKSAAQEEGLTSKDYDDRVVHDVMRDKFIALEEDKCKFVYQLCRAINAKTIVEAGTSYGVSTIYLGLAVSANVGATGGKGTVIATEHEPSKAAVARKHWEQCGELVSGVIDLREGDLRDTLKENVESVDFLLLDIWAPMALPTLKLIQPKLRHGAVIIADNTIGAAARYADFLEYIRDSKNGFATLTVPYNQGLEVCIYLPSN